MLKLIEPAMEYEREIRAYRKEFIECGDSMDGTGGLQGFEDPQDWIGYLNLHKDPRTVPEGRVPSTQYMLVREEDRKIVGMIDIRHCLNPFLEKYGGHIGYSVAPSERRKGYAAQMLKLALPKCRELGIDKVLITCVSGNEGSKRTIMKNGGVYESTVYEPDEGVNLERYRISIPKTENEEYMKRCYELAVRAGKKGFDTFGALLVHNGEILEEAENTADWEKGIFGHAEFNLVHRCANRYPDRVFKESTLYTSCAPCERCLCAIASLGIENVVYGVSYESFSQLTPHDAVPVDREGLLQKLGIRMRMTGPVLEEEGMHVFEWWGGEYRPLAELISEMAGIRAKGANEEQP